MRKLFMAATLVALAACSPGSGAAGDAGTAPVRILLAGDVSLGRDVAPIVADDGASIFAGLRHQVRSADLAMANLESPLTTRAHTADNPNDLRAAPGSAALLAAAGFDVMGLANNHATDGGPATVLDSLAALEAAGVSGVGGDVDRKSAERPLLLEMGGLTVAVVALDATGHALAATEDRPGVAVWGDDARNAIAALRAEADLVVVGVHGGAEYLFAPDDLMSGIGAELAALGVDVVWGHGAHVVQPVTLADPDGDGRPTVVATSLGNLVFDQSLPGTSDGAVLEVLAGTGGVTALRVGETAIESGRVSFAGWRVPAGDAALLDGEWWTLTDHRPGLTRPEPGELAGLGQGDVVAAGLGDVDDDGEDDLVVSFRRPFRPAALHELLPDVQWRDASGRSAHLGVFTKDFEPKWVASAMVRPVVELAVCDGAIAVGYSTLDAGAVVAGGAWAWNGFGWDEAPDLEGSVTPGCRDVDGNGRQDPVVVRMGAEGP